VYSKPSFFTCLNVVRVLTKESVELSFDHPTLDYVCTERALIQCDIHTRSIKLRIMMAYYLSLSHKTLDLSKKKTIDMKIVLYNENKNI
jgi:hypothetical protein